MTYNHLHKLLLAIVLGIILMPGNTFGLESSSFEGASLQLLPPEVKARIFNEAAVKEALQEFGTVSKDINEAMRQALLDRKVHIRASLLTPDNVETLKRVGDLDLDLSLDRADDKTMELTGKLTNLKKIDLREKLFTDKGFENINGLTGLTQIDLVGSSVSDKRLENLAGLTNLIALRLGSGGVTKPRTYEERLWASWSTWPKITNACLVHFRGLKSLRLLEIANTEVTEAAADELRQYLPDTKIFVLEGSVVFWSLSMSLERLHQF